MQDLGNNDIQYLYEKNGTHDPGGGLVGRVAKLYIEEKISENPHVSMTSIKKDLHEGDKVLGPYCDWIR